MKFANVRELKNKTSEILRKAEKEDVVITSPGKAAGHHHLRDGRGLRGLSAGTQPQISENTGDGAWRISQERRCWS